MIEILVMHRYVSWLACAAAICFLSFIIRYSIESRKPRNFPPGPPSVPILGNLHQLPLKKPFIKFHEWGKQYGPIVGLKFGPQNVVVLNSHQAVKELFDKRGAIYSSRPDSYVGNELLCPNDAHILLVPYGQEWRALRKAVQALLGVTAVDALLPVQEAEAMQNLYEIMDNPATSFNSIRRYSTAVILASVFGQRGVSYEAPKVQALYHAQEQFTEILAPGATPPVDAFPFLKYVPSFLAPYKSRASRIRCEQRTLYSNLLDETKARMGKPDNIPCFLAKLLGSQGKSGLNADQLIYVGGVLMEAGSDTTSATLHSFILAMIRCPHVLEKAQNELDGICGVSRSPGAADVGQAIYLQAVMNETLRWRPVAPGGVPHMLIQDDVYNGYFLPKGTIVFANTWSIHRDPAEYEWPDEFMPERYLTNKFGSKCTKGDSTDDDQRRVTYGFGAGRRVCPGQRLAENSLMINMAKIAWAFNISVDPASPQLDTDVSSGYSDGFVLGPKPFSASFTVRSPLHREVIEREFRQAKIFFKKYEN